MVPEELSCTTCGRFLAAWWFSKLGVPCWGPDYKGILLLGGRGVYVGSLIFANPRLVSAVGSGLRVCGSSGFRVQVEG